MINLLTGLIVLLVCGATCGAAESPRALRVSNDGFVRYSSTSGETTWSGTVSIEHPRFHLKARGTASLFGGPALRRKSGADVPLKAAKFEAQSQWISLIVLGSISVTVQDANGQAIVVPAQRVVYVPAEDRLLIDGKLWPQTRD
jgi:hypothetical protein